MVDFGDVVPATQVHREVRVSNKGDQEVTIRNRTTCGCVGVVPGELTLSGHRSALLRVSVSPPSAPGFHTYYVLGSLVAANQQLLFRLKVICRTGPDDGLVSPAFLVKAVSIEEMANSPVRLPPVYIADAGPDRLRVGEVTCSDNLSATWLDMDHTCPRGAKSHVIRVDPSVRWSGTTPPIPGSDLRGVLRIETNSPTRPTITVPVAILLTSSDVVLGQETVVFRGYRKGEPAKKCIAAHVRTERDRQPQVPLISGLPPWLDSSSRVGTDGSLEILFSLLPGKAQEEASGAHVLACQVSLLFTVYDVKRTVTVYAFP